MTTYPKVYMRSEKTGETVPATKLGETDDGRPIYQRIDGWNLESRYLPEVGLNEPLGYEFDADGNYVLQSVEDAEREMHDTY